MATDFACKIETDRPLRYVKELLHCILRTLIDLIQSKTRNWYRITEITLSIFEARFLPYSKRRLWLDSDGSAHNYTVNTRQ